MRSRLIHGRFRTGGGRLTGGILAGLVALSPALPARAAIDVDQLRPPVAPSPTLATVLTSTGRLVSVDVNAPETVIVDRTFSGPTNGETVVGMDVRPATGVLYAVTIDGAKTGRIYTVDAATATATRVTDIKGVTLTGSSFGIDFNPAKDLLRIVDDTDQNLRVNPDDGTTVVDTALAYAPGDENAQVSPTVTGSAYLNPFGGARSTALYGVDSNLDVLVKQDPPNSGTLTTVGQLAVDLQGGNGFDIASNDRGYLVSTPTGPVPGAKLLSVNLATGGATLLGALPPLAGTIVGLSVSHPGYRVGGGGPVIGLSPTGDLLQLDGPGNQLVSHSTPVSGLRAGDSVVAIDFRPANGQLYGLGRLGNLYVIDLQSGLAVALNRDSALLPLDGTSFGFDFNPVVDRIRITSDTGQNLRVEPNTGTVVSEDGTEQYAPGDANKGAGTVTGAAYTNSVVQPNGNGAPNTSLYVIDSAKSVLAIQDPPNDGVLKTVGPLGFTVGSGEVGFDIVPGTNLALATLERGDAGVATGQSDTLYSIDLGTGAARLVGRLPVDVTDIAVPGDGPTGRGYHLVASDGGVFTYGSARFSGSAGAVALQEPVVGIAERPVGSGYWLVARDGGIFSYGTARFAGSLGATPLNAPIVGIVPHPSGDGYWLFGADGGVFAFGLAKYFGSTGDIRLQQPIVAMTATPTGQGYWLFAADGGVFAYGDAGFFGSLGGLKLNQPIVSGAAAPNGQGYLLAASDGGVFAYGTGAPFRGSAGAEKLVSPVVGMTVDPDGSGYLLGARDGGVFAYDAQFAGSAGNVKLQQPVVGITSR